jgi:bifunctional non-homologous end joining protein LigD
MDRDAQRSSTRDDLVRPVGLGFESIPADMAVMKWRPSLSVPSFGLIESCIPTVAKKPPAGPDWVYELKHDGYRLLARKDGLDVRIYSRRGADFTCQFPRLVQAKKRLRAKSAMLDGEGVVYDQHGCRASTTPTASSTIARCR